MILLAPDKFKGTLSAAQVSQIITDALRERGISEDIISLPMADGGEGTAEALNAIPISDCPGCYILDDHTELIVSAEIVGHKGEESVLDRSSYPLGEAIKRAALNDTVTRIYIAVGGTATSDGGAGILQAIGANFYDKAGAIISEHITPRILADTTKITLPKDTISNLRNKLIGLIDVKAALLSGQISALTFAPQKGATTKDVALIKAALHNYDKLISPDRHSAYDGAGGGIGYAIATVIGAECLSGAEFILNHAAINWDDIRLVITGEGSIDNQTEAGKVVSAVSATATLHNIPYIAIGGRVSAEINNPAYISTMLQGEQAPKDTSEAAFRLRRTILSIKEI
jgi:glycerate kinase